MTALTGPPGVDRPEPGAVDVGAATLRCVSPGKGFSGDTAAHPTFRGLLELHAMTVHPCLSRRHVGALLLLVGLATGVPSRAATAADGVTLEQARAEQAAGRALLIDIREPAEHAQGVAPGARLLPMRQMGARLAEVPKDPKQPVLLICNTQNRSQATLDALRERGYTNVRFVQGGMSEWVRRGWPTVPPKL